MANLSKHIHEVSQPILVAEVFIFHQNSILMDKRSETKKKFPGFWSVPGGHIDEGEDPLAAAIREVREETGIAILPKDIKLKIVALHHHIDRHEIYVAFSFAVRLPEKPEKLIVSEEGETSWIDKDIAMTKENVFPPVKYYFKRILNDEPGILYNYSEWNNSQLVRVFSETVDKDS